MPLRENKMGVMPVGRLLLSMSLPIMVSMLIQALYNVVDSIFVAQISEEALTAVSLAFPVQNLMVAVGVGTGVGMNALLSRRLGEKDYAAANQAAQNGVFLAAINFLVFFVLGLLFSRVFFAMQTDDPRIIEDGYAYLTIVTMASLGAFGAITYERLLQSTGKTMLSMAAQMTGALTNIVLDPIMIFGYFGFPAMGTAGAALATVIGQFASFFVGMALNARFNKEVHVRLRGFRPDGATIRRIYSVGVPSILMQSIGSVMTFGMNRILMAFSSTATAVFGVYFKLQSFIFMPVFGLNNGMVPILAYNLGARKKERMSQTIRISILAAVCIMVLGFTLFQTAPHLLLSLFNASDVMLELGMSALRSVSWHFLLAGYCIVLSSVFQAVGRATYSLIMSITRQLGVLLPVAFLLSRAGGVHAVWWAFLIAESVAVVLSTIFLRKVNREIIAPLAQAPEA